MQLKKFIYTGLLFLGLSSASKAQELLKLNDALRLALENNFSIQLAKNEQEINRNNNSIGAAGMLPNIAATAGQDNTVTDTKQKFLSGATNDREGAKANQLNAGVELGWTIFDGFKMFAAKNKLESLQIQGELRVKMQIETVYSRISKAYYDIVQAKQMLELEKQSLQLSEQRLKWVQDKFEAGKASKAEVLNAQVDFNADKSRLLRQKNAVQNLKYNLNQLVGRAIETEFDVEKEIGKTAEYRLDSLSTLAAERNTSIQVLKSSKSIQTYAIKEIQAERYPSISLKTGYTYSKSESEAGFLQSSNNTGYHYGAGINLNVFSGSSVNRRSINARIGLKSTELILKDSLSKLQMSLNATYKNLQLAKDLLLMEEENLKVAKSNVELAGEQYQTGVISGLELRQAQQNLLAAETRYLSARYEAILAEIELKRLSGLLVE
ncbi:MAG: TolC family protein [Bacteroidia bacterium]